MDKWDASTFQEGPGRKLVSRVLAPEEIVFSLPELNWNLKKAGIRPIDAPGQPSEVVAKPLASIRQPQLEPAGTQQTSPSAATGTPGTASASQIRYDSPQAFGESLATHYAAAGHDPTAAMQVAAAIPPNVLKRLSQGRLKAIKVHPTIDAITNSFYDGDPELRQTSPSRRQRTLGFYDHSVCEIETDGGSDPRGTLAHEIGHAVDNEMGTGGPFGLSNALSEEDEFRYHWSKEIKSTGNLTAYAATEPEEGFAEYCRLLWGAGPAGRKDAEVEFPGVWAFFKKHGLV
jgi:hypothetical protein